MQINAINDRADADNTEYTFIYFIVHITTESYEYQHSQ
jgi:hypothetical protein